MRYGIFVICSLVAGLFALAMSNFPSRAQDSNSTTPRPEFVTSQACAGCHEEEAAKWRGSHHWAAMQLANEETVLGNFDNATLSKDGITSTFFRKDGGFWVRTDGPDGKLSDFEVKYTFGLTPLQQYLIEMPRGHVQALGIAWDTRPVEEGGQRWFHLYPGQSLQAGNPLHWTGIDQNWNYQCAWCHSTNLEKNYDPATDAFSTTWSEINVGCEACHGPGSGHIAWASQPEELRIGDTDAGFNLRFDERFDVSWIMRDTGTAKRSQPRSSEKEIQVCAGCHARREQFSDVPGDTQKLFDAFRPALITQRLYYPDGQQLEEVYKYGSFLQSRMHGEGVTCSDCHDPHSGKILFEGNDLCGQCHLPEKFDTWNHHHHRVESPGAQCASCHMPTTNYMIVDARHDHSLRIPRPDLSEALSAPNACNKCHTDKDAAWAAAEIDGWNGEKNAGAQDFAKLFAASDNGAPGSREALVAYLQEKPRPAIVAASALSRLARNPSAASLQLASEALRSPDVLVRVAAISNLSQADSQIRLNYLAPMLSDSSRLVRMDAARALAGEAENSMDARQSASFAKALSEYQQAQLFNAERPEANVNLAGLQMERGRFEEARTYFEKALRLEPTFTPATIGLAELLRGSGDQTGAMELLREAQQASPEDPQLAHALGLALVRLGKREEALEWLQKAARLGQDNPRFSYVYAIALHDTGAAANAIAVLKTGLLHHPYNRELLNALLSYLLEAGELQDGLKIAETLAQLEPDNPRFGDLVQRLKRALN